MAKNNTRINLARCIDNVKGRPSYTAYRAADRIFSLLKSTWASKPKSDDWSLLNVLMHNVIREVLEARNHTSVPVGQFVHMLNVAIHATLRGSSADVFIQLCMQVGLAPKFNSVVRQVNGRFELSPPSQD
jgi:hypothetical protein